MFLGLNNVAFVGSLSGGSAYDPDAQDYIDRVIAADVAAGDTSGLEVGVQDAINAFVVGCKADGIWNAIKACCIMAGARTLEGCLVPLAGAAPTRFGTAGGWDYDRKTGLLGNGTDNYLNSNRNNNADPQNSKHMAVYASAVTNSAISLIGSSTYNSTGFSSLGRISSSSSTRIAANVNGGGLAATVLGLELATGFAGANRPSATTINYRCNTTSNGLVVGSTSRNSAAPHNSGMRLWRMELSGTSYYADARLAFYSIGEALDLALFDARVTALTNAIAAAIP